MATKFFQSVGVLKILLPLDASITKFKTEAFSSIGPFAAYYNIQATLLGLLFQRRRFPALSDMIACLMEADTSALMIEIATLCCLFGHSVFYGSSDITSGSTG